MSDENDGKLKDVFLALNGKCILPKKLKKDHNYTIKTNVIVNECTEKSLQDGDDSYNLYFKGQLDGYAEILNDAGKMIYGKTRKSQSQDYRFQIYHYNKPELNMSDQEFYDYMMVLHRHYCPEIIELLLKWKKEGK
jgi:hypothetical protein